MNRSNGPIAVEACARRLGRAEAAVAGNGSMMMDGGRARGAPKTPPVYSPKGKAETVDPADAAGAPDMPLSKRVFDILVATALLVALSPVLLLIALGIKAVSPGPALYWQERVGRQGRRFTCFKFRSMRMENCPDDHQAHLAYLIASDEPMTKLDRDRDPRIIPMGSLLRASGLDELPQLLNVLRGDMSLVGPRPCIPYEYDEYANAHKRRLLATPGLTGLWQVNGKNHTTFTEMVELDIAYAYRQSVWLDIGILARTPAVIVSQLLDLTRKPTTPMAGNANTAEGEAS